MRIATIVDSYRGDASEDRLIAVQTGTTWILAVADGVGGRAGGGEAAEAAIQPVAAHAAGFSGGETDWSGFLVYVDAEVASYADGGETTFIVIEAGEERIKGASAGDSEAWFLTADSVFKLTEYQQRKPFVGSGDAVPMSFTFSVPPEGGTLIVATDGLFGPVSQAEICRIAQLFDVKEVAEGLVDAALGKASGQLPDDIAIVVCQWSRGARA